MTEVVIYTDGACLGNPGPGGWAAILSSGEHTKEIVGNEPRSTNQRMELTAALKALQALKWSCSVRLHSDSAYLINAFRQGWLDKWRRNGWRTANGSPVENQDLWKALLDVAEKHSITWIKVTGHADDELNNRCDALARQAAKEIRG
ncbi:MAG: ribonuclease HI [Limnochordia bacterium]|jgi:ribonuclease HI